MDKRGRKGRGGTKKERGEKRKGKEAPHLKFLATPLGASGQMLLRGVV